MAGAVHHQGSLGRRGSARPTRTLCIPCGWSSPADLKTTWTVPPSLETVHAVAATNGDQKNTTLLFACPPTERRGKRPDFQPGGKERYASISPRFRSLGGFPRREWRFPRMRTRSVQAGFFFRRIPGVVMGGVVLFIGRVVFLIQDDDDPQR
jgi:hypothetical protein